MTNEEKIEYLKKQQEILTRTERFLSLLKESQEATDKNEKSTQINNLHSIEITSYIRPGSDSVRYEKSIYEDTDFLNEIAAILIRMCEKRITEIQININNILK
jgi:hypothetical protein